MDLKLIRLFLLCFLVAEITADIDKNMKFLNESNFAEAIKSNNFFVVFTKDKLFDTFNKFWSQVGDLYNTNVTSQLRIAKVDCQDSKTLCDENKITEFLTLKFYAIEGSDYDPKPIADYVNSQIKNILKADRDFLQLFGTGNMLVEFMVPYCFYCKKISAVWSQLENVYENDSLITVTKIDCTKRRTACNKFDVSRYPTILHIVDGEKQEKYLGERTFEALKDYVQDKTGRKYQKTTAPTTTTTPMPKSESVVLDLDEDNFYDAIENGTTLVKFYADWCKHCTLLHEVWEKLGRDYIHDDLVKLAQVDCSGSKNDKLCQEQKCAGVPTINLYVNRVRVLTDHDEDTSYENLKDCIDSHITGGSEINEWTKRSKERKRIRKQQKKLKKKEDAEKEAQKGKCDNGNDHHGECGR